MKLLVRSLVIASFAFFLAFPAFAFPEDNLSNLLSGKILLDTDYNGEAWYVYPGDFHRYYLGTPSDAYTIMKNLSLGISNSNFSIIENSVPDRFKGLILLKVEDNGKAYYVNPEDKSLIYLENASSAYDLMNQYSLGITHDDLINIPIGKINLDYTNNQISREWQYLGWWGKVNQNYVPVMSAPDDASEKLGTFFNTNIVKIIGVERGGQIWYQIDGGKYPGAYVNSLYISSIAQPAPEKELIIPPEVYEGEYWIDVNISKKVLILYKYDQVIMATYVSTGIKETPTLPGIFHVWYKLKQTRMVGRPPIALHAYDLPNVPWVMYYRGSFAVHGTYWHDNFGTQRSSGCTNITQGDAKYIFDITGPEIGELDSVRSTIDNPGVLVNNHY